MMKKILAAAAATLAVAFMASCTAPAREATAPAWPVPAVESEDTIEEPIAEPEPEVPAAPELSIAQQNAIGTAEQYLSYTSFSRTGLIGQLEYEGYTTEEATFAVDTIAPDWHEQAGLKAEEYLEYTAFSRDGLYDQLIFEGFTDAEALTGLQTVGY